MEHLKQMIDEAWENRSLLREEIVQQTIREVIHLLDLRWILTYNQNKSRLFETTLIFYLFTIYFFLVI